MTLAFANSKMPPVRALLVLCIVLGHFSFYGVPALGAFRSIAPPAVALFLFISGFGLTRSFRTKGADYLQGFFTRRVFRIVLPALLVVLLHLLLGGGSATFVARFNDYIKEHDLVVPKEQDGRALPDYFDNPHNEYIQQLTDHGLPAMLLFIALLLFAVFRKREGWFPLLAPCSAAVLCYAVQALFSFSVCLVAPMFWVVLALSFNE